MPTAQTLHLRKVRAKTRKKLDPEMGSKVKQVNTLCSKWVSPRNVIRVDRTLTTDYANLVICDECKAQRNLSGVPGA